MRVHMKNGRARRKMFTDVNTKRNLVDMLAVDGFTLETSKTNVGEWNEGMNFEAVKGDERVFLDRPGKGERRDWQAMWNAFCDERGMDRD